MVIEGKQIILHESDDHQEFLGHKNLQLGDVMHSGYKYPKQKRAESREMLRSEDEDDEEEDDPQYMIILQNLKEHDKSYRIEYEEDGLCAVIKYEGASGSDAECDEEPREKPRKQQDGHQMPRADTRRILDSHCTRSGEMKMLTSRKTRSKSKSELEEKKKLLGKNKEPQSRRKLRSATKQTDEHLNRVPDADARPTPTRETGKLTRKNPRSKSRSEKEEDVVKLDSVCHTSRKRKRLSNKSKSEHDENIIQFDPEYLNFFQNFKAVNGRCVFMFEGAEVVYWTNSGDGSKMKEDDDDNKSYSDVEIIDSTAFFKKNKGSNSNHRDATGHSEFRHKVIAALRKPFDKEEYKKLRQDVELHKPRERHIDLRGGRERPVATQKYGKSYLDYHPDLKKLLEAQDNLPKRLNLLRGFFLWIKHPGAFCPWLDDECLAVQPRSR